MRNLTFASMLPLSLLLAGPAAAEATQAEASRLKAVFETYLGNKSGTVSVTPQGEAYAVALDAGPLLATLPFPNATFATKPWTFMAKPLGGGKWDVKGNSPSAIAFKLRDFLDVEWRSETMSFTGNYDEALLSFTETNSTTTGDMYSQLTTTPEGRTEQVQRLVRSTSRVFDVTGTADSLSFTQEGRQEGMTGTYSAPIPGAAAINARYSVAKVNSLIKVRGLRNRKSMELWAFVAAHPSLDALKLKQEELRAKVKAILPLASQIDGNAGYDSIAVNTPIGKFAVANIKATVNLDMEANQLGEVVDMNGLALPPGLAPAWAEPLIPVDANFGFVAGGMRMASLMEVLVDNADLNSPNWLKPGIEPQLMAAVMPSDGKLLVSLKPLRVKAKAYEITGSGDLTAAVFGSQGKAEVTMTGLDAVIAGLAAAGTDPDAAEFKQFAESAKLLAKPGANGAHVWVIEGSQTGGILVNGKQVF